MFHKITFDPLYPALELLPLIAVQALRRATPIQDNVTLTCSDDIFAAVLMPMMHVIFFTKIFQI